MPSNELFNTYGASKQAEIIQKLRILFQGNERGYGVGEVKGAKFNEDKNKWIPGSVRWAWGKAGEQEWRLHLHGERFLGIGPILDDGNVWFACIDVDKTQDNTNYDFNYADEMGKIKRSGFPLVVFRTKSGGLRVTIFFSEPVEAELAIKRMKQIAAQLGYAGQEIFPKQTKLDVEHGDCPSWIYLPFGPTGNDQFPEQCCMNDSGNPMDLYESVIYATRKRVTKQEFYGLFVAEINAKANGKANGKNHPKGQWVTPSASELYEESIKTMFWDGPICLWIIAHAKSTNDQHYFLFNCGIFLKRKYPSNWDKALEWVNVNVLRPVGDPTKLLEMIKDLRNRGDRPYEYTCKTAPICNHCHAHACKQRPYGVGQGNGIDHSDWGMTIVNREPRIFFLNVGDHRILFDAAELLNQQRYKEKCLSFGVPAPHTIKRDEWENLINRNVEDATIVEPSILLRTNAEEYRALERFFSANIPNMVRAKGDEYLSGKVGDYVRVREKEERIYFKEPSLRLFCDRSLAFRRNDAEAMTMFLEKEAEFHPRNELRDWFRSTYSLRFNQFDPGLIDKWIHPNEEQEDGK